MNEEMDIPLSRKVGRELGEHVGSRFIDRKIEMVQEFDLEIRGVENIQDLSNTPVIYAANHEIPSGKLDLQSGLSPDAFTIARAIHETSGADAKIVSKSDDGWNGIGLRGYVQKKDRNFRQGVVEGMGFVPVRKNPGSFNRDFLVQASNVLEGNGSLILFSQGNWYPEFDASERVKSGMYFLARRNNALIVPTFIQGAREWRPNQQVKIAFGTAFSTEGKNRVEVSEEWLHDMTSLQNSFSSHSTEE